MRTRCRSTIPLFLVLLLLTGPSNGDRRQQLRRRRHQERKLDRRPAWNNWSRNHDGKHLPDSGAQRNCTDWEDRYNYYMYRRHHPDMMDPCHADDDDNDEEADDDYVGIVSVPRSPPLFNPSPAEPEPITTRPPSPAGPPPSPWMVQPAPTRPSNDTHNSYYADREPPESESPMNIPVSDSSDDGHDKIIKDDDFVYATVYVSLKPNQTSIEPVVTETVTRLLNETFDDRITLYLPPRQQRRRLLQTHLHRSREHATAAARRFRQGQRHLQQAPSSNNASLFYFNLVHYDTESDLVARQSQEHDGCDCWYWKYRLGYECFWKHNASRVTHMLVLQNISAYMNTTLESITTSLYLQEELQEATGSDDIVVYLDEEDIYKASSNNQNSTNITEEEDDNVNDTSGSGSPTYSQPLDSNEWDWRRYFGLALFLTTFSVSLIYVDWQCWRDRQSSKRQVWGNLASEEGVNELLKTGWKVQQGGGGGGTSNSKTNRVTMEIYDKSKWGYESDDSMLMGGYQQHEPLPTVLTHAESDTQQCTTTQPPSPHTSPRTPVVVLPLDDAANINSSSPGNSNSPEQEAAVAAAVAAVARRSVHELPPAPPLIPMPPPPGPPSLP